MMEQPRTEHPRTEHPRTEQPRTEQSDQAAPLPPATDQADPTRPQDPRPDADAGGTLLDPATADALAEGWERVQTRFLDAPQQAVQDADELVGVAMTHLSERMTAQRDQLEEQWRGGQTVSTEELRRTLQRYRAFFQRLMAA